MNLVVILLQLGLLFISIYDNNGQDCSRKRDLSGKATKKQEEFVNCWDGKDRANGKSDLVVLIDTSGSMGWNGFNTAKRFVESLLGEIRIAFNATRIAIGTFSSQHRINFNYIWYPKPEYHKCQFNEDFKNKLRYDGEMTNLKGTLQDSLNVFKELYNDKRHFMRQGTNRARAVLLLTDGYGNMRGSQVDWNLGRDGTPEARRLSLYQVEIYTVGITNSIDRDMLKKIATSPKFFMEASSFQELGNLAHNIRGGKSYLRLSYICTFIDFWQPPEKNYMNRNFTLN